MQSGKSQMEKGNLKSINYEREKKKMVNNNAGERKRK